ncbi:MAG: apolipoprotein N-acyltransferase [Deltaproteobacteria bacterium]|jgi:apolipoprotein N-acyltransferase|nr:apolipoprotein N-acyltransferase [Deltaproteobacteria bacterium]
MSLLEERRRRLALTGYVAATFLAFPHELPWGGALDLGWLMAWLVPAALVNGIEGLGPRRAAGRAFLASLVAHALLFHWFFVVTVVYGGMPAALGVLSPLLPALYVAVFTALFAWLWSLARIRGVAGVLLGAAVWVTVDWARGHALGGFPWATLGYALHRDVPLLGLTRWTGVYGLSFVAAAWGIALAGLWPRPRARAGRTLALVAGLVVMAHGLGPLLQRSDFGSVEEIRIAAVQGNIDQAEKWSEERRERILDRYARLTEQAAERGAAWVVWPETALPGLLEVDPSLSARLKLLAQRHDVVLVIGGMGVAPDESGTRIGAFFDSAFVIDPEGRILDRYDKTHLVPFGEYVPLRELLGHFFQALARGLSTMDVTAGSAPRAILVAGGEALEPPYRIGVPICYELLFPDLVRRFADSGAGVLLAITNDAWYGRTGAPHQFLAMTVLRSAENGRWTVRAANTGVSAIIDDRGRVREASALFEEGVLVADVPIVRSGEATFYARHGDVFAWLCVAATGVGLGCGSFVARRPRPGGDVSGLEDFEGNE